MYMDSVGPCPCDNLCCKDDNDGDSSNPDIDDNQKEVVSIASVEIGDTNNEQNGSTKDKNKSSSFYAEAI